MIKRLLKLMLAFIYRPFGTYKLNQWKKPEIDDIYISLEKLIQSNKSLARFGNGEFDIIWGLSEGFQKPSESLGIRLKEILHSHSDNLLIGITDFIITYLTCAHMSKLLPILGQEKCQSHY